MKIIFRVISSRHAHFLFSTMLKLDNDYASTGHATTIPTFLNRHQSPRRMLLEKRSIETFGARLKDYEHADMAIKDRENTPGVFDTESRVSLDGVCVVKPSPRWFHDMCYLSSNEQEGYI